MKIIEDIEKWNILKAAMKEKGYKPYTWQYNVNQEEGLHVFFYRKDSEILKHVEVVTHNKVIAEDMNLSKW